MCRGRVFARKGLGKKERDSESKGFGFPWRRRGSASLKLAGASFFYNYLPSVSIDKFALIYGSEESCRGVVQYARDVALAFLA